MCLSLSLAYVRKTRTSLDPEERTMSYVVGNLLNAYLTYFPRSIINHFENQGIYKNDMHTSCAQDLKRKSVLKKLNRYPSSY